MTDLLDAPRARKAASRPATRGRATDAAAPGAPAWVPLALRGTAAAFGDLVVTLVVVVTLVLLTWTADSRSHSGAAQAIRVGVSGWLLGLHTRVHAGPAVVGLPPLLLTAACALLLARSVRHLLALTASSGPVARRGALTMVAAVAVPFAVLAGLLAAAVDTPTLHPSPATAVVGGLAVGALGGGWGLWRGRAHLAPGAGVRLPAEVLSALRAGGLALACLGGSALVLAAAMLARHFGEAQQVSAALAPGRVGAVSLTLLQVAFAPTLVVGAASWLVGPGFAVGTATSVTPWGTALGPVPAVPALAALPHGSARIGWVVLLVPVLCGAAAAVVALRSRPTGAWWRTPALLAGAAGVAALGLVMIAYAAGGPLGPGRLLTVGPSGWRVGAALFGELAVGEWTVWLVDLAWRHRDRWTRRTPQVQ